jgi:RNA polymerase sigma-70 factor (ECF subfamily)
MLMTPHPIDVTRLRAELVGYLQRRGQSVDDAEDLVQEAFARFHRAGHRAEDADARPLLFVISKNLLKDQWKVANRERARMVGQDVDAVVAAWEIAPSEAPSADRHSIGRQELAGVAEAIRALPPRCRDAFLLHRFEDLSYRQIAGRLGVSVSMVEKHLAEALRRLKAAREDLG